LFSCAGVLVKRDTPKEAKPCPAKASPNKPPKTQAVESTVQGKDCKEKKRHVDQASSVQLAAIHSLAELTEFLTAETERRKQDRKSCWSRRLSQLEWKTLRQAVRTALNPKTPNKSLKLARRMLREAVVS